LDEAFPAGEEREGKGRKCVKKQHKTATLSPGAYKEPEKQQSKNAR